MTVNGFCKFPFCNEARSNLCIMILYILLPSPVYQAAEILHMFNLVKLIQLPGKRGRVMS